jgi:hypothetical protein
MDELGPQMETVSVHEAKRHFSELLDPAQEGQEFVIAKAGGPVAQSRAEPITLLANDAVLVGYGSLVQVV